MAEEEVVAIPAPPVDLKRKLDDIEPEVTEKHNESDGISNGVILDDNRTASDSSQAKRPKLNDEASDGLDNVKIQENGSPVKEKEEEVLEEEKHEEIKEEESEKPSVQQDTEPLIEEVKEPVNGDESENKTGDVDQQLVKLEDNQQSSAEAPNSQENLVEECKDANGGEPQKEIDEESKELVDGNGSQNEIGDESKEVTRRIEVPSSKVGVLIGKHGDNIRNLQFNSGAKIQILRDSEADPNAVSRPVDIIGTVACIEKAEKLINATIAEAEAGGPSSLVARGHVATHSVGISEQIELKVPNDKVGVIIGRGGETIKNMQTRSGARIQLIPQHAEGEGFKERTVRISGDKRQIDIATELIKDVMYQNPRPSPYSGSGGYNQPPYRPRGPGGPPQWGSRGPYPPHPYDYNRGPYSSQGSHYNSGYNNYPPQHMPPRGGYGWDHRPPPYSGPYDYYGRQGPPNSGPPPPSGPGGPPPSHYGYSQSHGPPDYGHSGPPYSQTGHQQSYGQTYDNNPPMQPPYGSSYPPAGGGQPGYSQMHQPGGRPYGDQQGPVQQGYGPPRPAAAASSGDVPYQGPTPAAAAAAAAAPPSYGSTNMAPQQQQYGYNTSSGGQQQTYPSYSSAPTDGYNNGTQAPATGPTYQQQPNILPPAGSTHDQQAGYGGQVAPPGGYSSYPSSQPGYGTAQTQNSGSYGYNTSSQDPNYGYGGAPGSQPLYAQAAPTQTGYEQQAPTQPAGYAGAPGIAQVKTQSPQTAYGQYDASQAYAAPR